jgi:hypothetical protein
MRRRQLPTRLVPVLSLLFLGGCSFGSPNDLIEVTDEVSASALVESNWYPGTGFLIDREERLFLTTNITAGHADEVQVVFPVVVDGKALVRRSAWLDRAKERSVKGRVLISDTQRDLAVLRLASVPDDVPELKLAGTSPVKGAQVHFLGAGPKASQVWAHASGTVQKVEPRPMPIVGLKKATNHVIELDVAGSQARRVAGGAVLNESNEVVGIIAVGEAQGGALLCTDVSEIRATVAAVYRTFAMYAYDRKEYDVAIRYSDRALAVWPGDALAYNERGAAWSQKDQFPKAIADYSKALSLEPRLTVAYRNRGSAYHHQGKYREAIADCTRAVELQPRYLSAYSIRRDAYSRLGMQKEVQGDDQILAVMTQPQWKMVGVTGGNPQYSPRTEGEEIDRSVTGSSQTVTDSSGRTLTAGSDGYWYGSDGKRYITIGGTRGVMPGAGMPLK